MRRKLVKFILFVAVVCGLVTGIKNVNIEPTEIIEDNDFIETTNEIYIDELNLPLIEVDTLNPLRTQNSQVSNILKLIYEPLIENIEYVLADEIVKMDSNTWIIKLKKNILWHGGETFSSDDVIFTFNTIKNNTLIYSDNLSNVKETLKLDDNSIKIVLENPDDYFITKLNVPIIPEFYYKNDGFLNEEKSNKPIGTGPYKYSNIDTDGNMFLEFNTSWWKSDDVKLTKINLYKYATYGEAVKAFKSTEVDMIVTNMAEWKDKFGTIGLNFYSFENSEFEVIIPNCNNAVLSENSVRKAILYGINRENLINSTYDDNAVVSDVPIHTNSQNSINNAEYDVEKAKQILINASWIQNENGWQKEIDGKIYNLNFDLLVNSESKKKMEVAEKIKNDLSEIGININVKKVSKEKLIDSLTQDKFELVLSSMDIKNEVFIQEQVNANSVLNYANYNSNAMQKILKDMRVDKNSYNENVNAFVQLYKNDLPYIGLYFKTSTILTNKSVKGNFEPTWSNYYRNITSFCK